jgi:hypothetical protein
MLKMFGAAVQNSVALVNGPLRFVHPCLNSINKAHYNLHSSPNMRHVGCSRNAYKIFLNKDEGEGLFEKCRTDAKIIA